MALLVAEVSTVLLRWMLFGSALFLRPLLRTTLLLRVRLRRTLFLATLRWVRHGRRLRTALRNMLGRSALGRRMFIMLRDGRQCKQNANRKKSKYDFHPIQPSTILVSEVLRRMDDCEIANCW
jgi:hypothetical protein